MAGRDKPNGQVMSHDPLAEMEEETTAEAVASVPPEPAAESGAEAPSAPPAEGAVDLGDSLTIPDVAEVLERFRAALGPGGTLRIRAAELEQVDAAGVQLLCAVVKDLRSQAQEVAWEGVSGVLQQAARQLGLERDLGL